MMRLNKFLGCALVCACFAGCGSDDDDSSDREPSGSKSSSIKSDGSRLAGCFGDSDCKNDLTCYGADTDSMTATAGFCIEKCNYDDPFVKEHNCPDIDKVAAVCSADSQCRIDCTGSGKGDGKCPASMECRDADPTDMTAYRCLYPVGTNRGTKKAWEECNPNHGDADCAAPNTCVPFGSGENVRGYCSAPCMNESECSAPDGVTARPLCPATLDACSLDCTDGATCPAGMDCVDTTPGNQTTMRCRFAPPNTTGGADMPGMMSGGMMSGMM